MDTTLPTRRAFLAGAGVASLGFSVLPTTVLVAAESAARPAAKLKAAVIGHTGRGDYGHGLDAIFTRRPEVELVALADPDEEGRVKTAAKIGAPRTYADYREMLQKEKPKVVCVAMRHADQHHAIIRDCINIRAHVYTEKPFVTAPAEADELLKLAATTGRRIAVAHTMRMTPTVVKLKEAISDGLIGELVEMRAYGKQDARAGGEDMMVLGTHLFDLMRLFAGDPLSCSAEVLVKGKPARKEDRRRVKDNIGYIAGDEVFARFGFPKGVNASFTSSARLRETIGHWGIELYGSVGVARINCDLAPNVFVRKTSGWSARGKNDEWEPLDATLAKSAPDHNLGPVGDWLVAIANKREPECSAKNGAWAVEMNAAVYRSALGGRTVKFPLPERTHPLA